jgi:hypothetical protein
MTAFLDGFGSLNANFFLGVSIEGDEAGPVKAVSGGTLDDAGV